MMTSIAVSILGKMLEQSWYKSCSHPHNIEIVPFRKGGSTLKPLRQSEPFIRQYRLGSNLKASGCHVIPTILRPRSPRLLP